MGMPLRALHVVFAIAFYPEVLLAFKFSVVVMHCICTVNFRKMEHPQKIHQLDVQFVCLERILRGQEVNLCHQRMD